MSTSVVQSVQGMPRAAGQPAPRIAEDTIIVQIAALPGAFPLKGLQPPAPEAIGQGDHQPLLSRGEPGDQPGQLPKLGLIDDGCPMHLLILSLCFGIRLGMLEPILDRWPSSLDVGSPAFSWFHLKFTCVGATVTTSRTAKVISVSSTIPSQRCLAWSSRRRRPLASVGDAPDVAALRDYSR
jgi:hypothetical protein